MTAFTHPASKHCLSCQRLNECDSRRYHGCRGTAETQRQQSAAVGDVVREAEKGGSPSPQTFGEQSEGGRVSGRDIQARIQHVRAAIEAAKAARRPDALRAEVKSSQDQPLTWLLPACARLWYYRHLQHALLLALLSKAISDGPLLRMCSLSMFCRR